MTDASHRTHVTFAQAACTLAMKSAFAMSTRCVLAGMARAVRLAHEPSEFEPVVVRNLTPTFPSLMRCYDFVEALASRVGQQVCVFQFTIAEPGRGLLSLERIHRNAGFVGNSRQNPGLSGNGCLRNRGAELKA